MIDRSAFLGHRNSGDVISLLSSSTSLNKAGFHCISEAAFRTFEDKVPHLFRDGLGLLRTLDARMVAGEHNSTDNVVRRLVLTAAVCAPPDLWLLRHVLAIHAHLGTLSFLVNGGAIAPDSFAATHSIDRRELAADLELLCARGYLDCDEQDGRNGVFTLSRDPVARSLFVYAAERMQSSISSQEPVSLLYNAFLSSPDPTSVQAMSEFLEMPDELSTGVSEMIGWVAGPLEIEIGYRLVSLVLTLHKIGVAALLAVEDVPLSDALPAAPPQVTKLFMLAGLVTEDGRTTALAARVFGRGIGPFGIIHSYYPYVETRERFSFRDGQGGLCGAHVARAENVDSSQAANRKTFQMANDALDLFCARYSVCFSVFIEHALGCGEATRQRWEYDRATGRSEGVTYVGADLEDAAIQRARAAMNDGILPPDMVLISGVDIGQPSALLDALAKSGLSSEGAVMLVGNGFHEIRNQNDEGMIAVFHAYAKAGIILVFTEETALSSDDLRATGWNTYHAGFRYVHTLSGQSLRPPVETPGMPLSWWDCAERGGYIVLDEMTRATRGIFPCERPHNPPISVTYFAVPRGSI